MKRIVKELKWISVKDELPQTKPSMDGLTSCYVVFKTNLGIPGIGIFREDDDGEQYFIDFSNQTHQVKRYLKEKKPGHAVVTHWFPVPRVSKTSFPASKAVQVK